MIDRPVIGQIARTSVNKVEKLEVFGQLNQVEWDAFVACVKACGAPYGSRLTIRERSYPQGIPVLRFLPKKAFKKAKRPKRAGRKKH